MRVSTLGVGSRRRLIMTPSVTRRGRRVWVQEGQYSVGGTLEKGPPPGVSEDERDKSSCPRVSTGRLTRPSDPPPHPVSLVLPSVLESKGPFDAYF